MRTASERLMLCSFDEDDNLVDFREPPPTDVAALIEANPREAWEVVRDLLIVGPWDDPVLGVRKALNAPEIIAYAWEKNGIPDCGWCVEARRHRHDGQRADESMGGLAEARAAADAALREAGYILVEDADDGS